MRASHKPDLERELETTSRFGNKCFIACKALGGGGEPSLATPMSPCVRKLIVNTVRQKINTKIFTSKKFWVLILMETAV